MSAERPLVSVLTPTWNAAAFVRETVESVLAQTYDRVEHVLVDDASDDGTADLLDEYARRRPDRVRVLRRDVRAGPCRRRNDALDVARGELLAWLDHDDVWDARKLELQVDALLGDPQAVLCYTQFEEFHGESGASLSRSSIVPGGDLLRRLAVEGCFIASSTVLFRRDAMERRGLRFRDADFSFGDDYVLWLGLALEGTGLLVDEPLARLRRHAGNESARLARENFYLRRLELLREFATTFSDARARLGPARRLGAARHYAAAALYELDRGRRRRAAFAAARSAAHDPIGAIRVAAWALRRPRRLKRAVAPLSHPAARIPQSRR